jgi:hypothetical protein
MYARTVARRNADGSTTRYVQLAVTEMPEGGGSPRARVVHNFGREDQLDRWAIWRLVRSLSRFKPEWAMSGPSDETTRTVELTDFERESAHTWLQDSMDRIAGSFPRTEWGQDAELAACRRVLDKLSKSEQ